MNELTHWGIKGQKWGVRRFENPDGTLTEAGKKRYGKDSKKQRFIKNGNTYLRKGTRLNSVSGTYYDSEQYKNRPNRWMYTYRADEDWDNKVYKGPFVAYLINRGAQYCAEHKYETVKDLKIPSRQQRIEEFKNLNVKNLSKDLKSVQKELIKMKVGGPEYQRKIEKFNPKNIKTEEDWETAYSIFQHAMESSWFYKSTKEYAEKLSSKYDAMVDDNNKDVYNRAIDPIIIFRANESLKNIKDTPIADFVTADEVKKNYTDVSVELAKKGEFVKI